MMGVQWTRASRRHDRMQLEIHLGIRSEAKLRILVDGFQEFKHQMVYLFLSFAQTRAWNSPLVPAVGAVLYVL